MIHFNSGMHTHDGRKAKVYLHCNESAVDPSIIVDGNFTAGTNYVSNVLSTYYAQFRIMFTTLPKGIQPHSKGSLS